MLLLTTKLKVPPARPQNLARLRLIEQLEQSVQNNNRLTLLVAPAGFGKSTLLTSWLTLYPHQVSWLSCDENDSHFPHFLFYLVSTLQPHFPAIGEELLNFLQTEQESPVELVLTSLLNAATLLKEVLVLVLEDYHLVTNPKADAAVTFLLQHLPPQMHLIITSREDPDLSLSRLRARDQLTEFRADDLRFTLEESTTFLQQSSNLKLSLSQIAFLEQRTEGWIAGLQLAVLSLKNQEDVEHFIANFSGNHRYIMDYLLDEVVDQQPENIKEFLLQTAILRRMSGELCAAVTGKAAGQLTLERLEANNLFIVPLDETRQWYRYHHLFGELLQFRLGRTYPEQIGELHLRAAHWYEAQGLWDEAVYHINQSAQVGELERILAKAIETLIHRNQLGLALTWFESIPEELIKQHLKLTLYKGWVLALIGQTALSVHYAELAKVLLPSDGAKLELGLLEAMQAYNARLELDVPAAIEHGDRALDLLGELAPIIQNIVSMLLGQARLLIPSSFDAGMQLIRKALEAANQMDNRFVLFNSLSTLVFVLIGQARIREATLLLDQFDTHFEKSGTDKFKTNLTWVPTLRATIYYLTNELDKAQEELNQVIKDEQLVTLEWLGNTWAYMVQALIYQAEGQFNKALHIFRRVETAQVTLPPTIHATPYKISLLLKLEIFEEAAICIKSENLTPTDYITPEKDDYYLCLARFLTTQKRFEEALSVLKTLENLENSMQIYYRLATVHILQANVYLRMQRRSIARDYLAKAVTLVSNQKLYRTFLDEDPLIAELLLEVRSTNARFVDELLAMYRQPKLSESPLVEPLSEREQEILRLIAQGLNNREIGERLILAVGTVKRHAVNIFGKLEVNSRTEAVARARDLGLL